MKKILTVFAAVALLALPAVAAAQVNTGSGIGSTFGLGTADLESTVIRVVQWVLGFLAIVALIMVLWGVFGVISAAGSEDRAAFAKKTIAAALIGLVVILLAWAIVTFVIKNAVAVSAG